MTSFLTDAAASHNAGASRPRGVGVEEQRFLAKPGNPQVAHRAGEILEGQRAAASEVGGEICDSVVELVSPVTPSAAEDAVIDPTASSPEPAGAPSR